VPPQGPLRICFGQVCGQTYSMLPSTQLPQFLQPKISFFDRYSTRSNAWLSAGWRSSQANALLSSRRAGVSSGCFTHGTGSAVAAASSTIGRNVRDGFGSCGGS
jgi:hypothetical protein